MLRWKDVTSYSRGEQGRVEPRTWMVAVEGLEIVVTRHIHFPGQWLCRCAPLFEIEALHALDVDNARREALVVVRRVLRRFEAAARILDAET